MLATLTNEKAATLTSHAAHSDHQPGAGAAFRHDVLEGLSKTRKEIPARWLYDMRGSLLFEAITKLPEYYPTRTETGLLQTYAGEAAEFIGQDGTLVEFGSGSSLKTRELLRCMPRARYVPIDICGEILDEAAQLLRASFPHVSINPIKADFTNAMRLHGIAPGKGVMGFFPGSTIGNFDPVAATELLIAMRDTLGDDAFLLIGIDRVKAVDRLVEAYDDAEGVTALFNLNLLDRINRELAGTIPVNSFAHKAVWNGPASRIEMHLEARSDLTFEVGSLGFKMQAGETIHTENSHKFHPDQMHHLLRAGGWRTIRHWTDAQRDFSLILAKADSDRRGYFKPL